MWVQYSKVRNASWFGGTVQANPPANTVLADTGAITAADTASGVEYMFTVVISASAAAQVRIEHRDAANANNISVVTLLVPASLVWFPLNKLIKNGERVRVVQDQALTGNISAVINMIRVHD